jgi:RNA polymerase sigma factor (sigma-70 family)
MDADAQRSQLAATLRRVAAGDRAALRTVYQETSARLFGICLRILNDQADAESVLQDVYLAVWLKAGTFDPERASPITWLAGVARTRAIDRLRSRPTEALRKAADPSKNMTVALDEVVPADQHMRLITCVGELDDQQSAAIRAAFLDGLTYEQLAAEAKIPVDTMKSLIRPALLKLKACIEQ